MIRKYSLSEMSSHEIRTLCARSESDIRAIRERVRPILDDVRDFGDKSLIKYTREFDGVDISTVPLEVTPSEIAAAADALAPNVRKAIDLAARNIRCFHEAQLPQPMWLKEVSPGVLAGEKITPITSVGLYVPRGKGCFPSVMLMLAIPAVVAGVPDVIVCTPPAKDGGADHASLYAASISGVRRIFRVGGAQAIAAMAFGTETVPRMRKVLGPGNTYVSAAKRELYGVLDVGIPAGPSEAIILTDGSVPARIAAHDLLIEAEHGPDLASLLVTTSAAVAAEVEQLLPRLIEQLPLERQQYCSHVMANYGGIVLAKDLDSAVNFINEFAPEHLEVMTSDPFSLLTKIVNAGEILLGSRAPITIGNFCLGVNAILPTGGFAHTFSCVTIFDYLKRTSIGYLTEEGYRELAPIAKILAEYEGFSAHASAIEERDRSGE